VWDCRESDLPTAHGNNYRVSKRECGARGKNREHSHARISRYRTKKHYQEQRHSKVRSEEQQHCPLDCRNISKDSSFIEQETDCTRLLNLMYKLLWTFICGVSHVGWLPSWCHSDTKQYFLQNKHDRQTAPNTDQFSGCSRI
jgi:hypothetical protein